MAGSSDPTTQLPAAEPEKLSSVLEGLHGEPAGTGLVEGRRAEGGSGEWLPSARARCLLLRWPREGEESLGSLSVRRHLVSGEEWG